MQPGLCARQLLSYTQGLRLQRLPLLMNGACTVQNTHQPVLQSVNPGHSGVMRGLHGIQQRILVTQQHLVITRERGECIEHRAADESRCMRAAADVPSTHSTGHARNQRAASPAPPLAWHRARGCRWMLRSAPRRMAPRLPGRW